MKISKLFTLLFVLLELSIISEAQNYYVDPNKGSDNNTGLSLDNPFKTIHKARNVVRGVRNNMTKDIRVFLRGGVYQLDSTLILTQNDGGTNNHSIRYERYNCETPIISGGIKISNWQLHDVNKNIYKAVLEEPIDSRQLYVNGIRAIRARSVDATGWEENGDGYDCPEEVNNWQNISQVEVVSHVVWKCHRGPIAEIRNGHVKMVQPYWDNLHQQYNAPAIWIENAYELLDSAGEWYLDRSKSTLYYKPREGEHMSTAEIFLAKEETLLRCVNVQNLEMRGLTFSYGTWLYPNTSNGFPCHQADQMLSNQTWKDFEQMPGNILLDHCSNVKFVSCTFNHLGATGLQIGKGCQNNVVYNSSFNDISGSAISVGSLNDSFPPVSDYVKRNRIDNNLITNVAVEFTGSVGIIIGYTQNTLVTHNEIRNLPYTGISVGWGWSNTETVASGNEISYNLIDSVMTVMHDGGGIYTLSAQNGTQIHHNYIQNEIHENAALHVDEGSSYIHFYENVFENVFAWINLWSVTSLRDTIENNYFDNEKNIFSGTDCITRNNVYVNDGNWPTAARDIIKSAGRIPVGRCSYNASSGQPTLKYYPNPASATLNVVNEQGNYPESYSVEVYNVLGNLIYSTYQDRFQDHLSIDTKAYPSGIYFLKIVSGEFVYRSKFIKL